MFIGADFAAVGTTDKTVLVYQEQEGCGKPDCRACRNSREGFARIKGWNEAREEAKKLGLAETLTENSLKTITTQIDGYFDGQIKAKKQALESNNNELRALADRRDKLNQHNAGLSKEISDLETARDTVAKAVTEAIPKKRGKFFFRPSRTGESAGHYIEKFDDGSMTCTCQAGVYGNNCWARDEVRTYGSYGGVYTFYGSSWLFDTQAEAARAKALAK